MQKIDIALATDDNYAIGCGVAIHSTLKNLKENVRATIHVGYSNLNTDSKTRIERIVRQHDSLLRWHYIDQKTLGSLGNIKIPQYWTKEAFFRLLLPNLLPRINEILYLDVDVLVRADVSVLFENHSTRLIRACIDMTQPTAELQVPNFECYDLNADDFVVNSGVCLLNLRGIRKTPLIERCVQLLTEHKDDMSFIDQTAINIAFKGNIDFLPINWNVFPLLISKEWLSPLESIQPFDDDVRTNPKIVHFVVGGKKPWNRCEDSEFADEWRAYLYDSQWFHSEMELFKWVLEFRWNKKTLWQIWKWRSI